MYLLKLPSFMAIEPQGWDHLNFQPPVTDHHSFNKPPSDTFSAYNTALTTIRWRHSPSDYSKLQSNARINRWSDGSLTLQLASDPTTQYEMDGNPLAPPQRNPLKPTPVSVRTASQRAGRYGTDLGEKYNPSKDAFTYLLRPHQETSSMIVTQKITAGLSIKQSATVEDDAIERLQASLAKASNASKVAGGDGVNIQPEFENPEAAKQAALKAVKQKEAQDKKAQAARDREAARSDRMLGRKGLSGSRYNGLNVGMLEDDEDGEGGRGRPSPNKARKPRRRRNSEYSEDEDFGRKRFSREDEYDDEDDFLAPSDEEEVVEDDDDPDDGIVEDAFRRERTPKRDREEVEDDEADAPGEEDEEETQAPRTKRRRVVEDDDEE
jgi:RNA polymerase-associated protein LEO1